MSETKRTYEVSGMKCNGCVATAQQALSGLPGVVEASVDLASGRAVVVGEVAPEAVVQALTAAGYPATAIDA